MLCSARRRAALSAIKAVEDSKARVDLNLVATPAGNVVEVQGTAEGAPVPRANIDKMVDAGMEAVKSLCSLQKDVLLRAEVDLASLLLG